MSIDKEDTMSDESTLADDVRRVAGIMFRQGHAAREGGADKLAQRALVLRRHLRRLAVRLGRKETAAGLEQASQAIEEARRISAEIIAAADRYMEKHGDTD